ncbi:hypothetical protein PybrP1_012545, partial [[Pythium] brassicae (nom. inval.)]
MKKLLSRATKRTDAADPALPQQHQQPPPLPQSTNAVTLLPSDVQAFAVASELSESQKRGFAGLCACALPDINDDSSELQWSKSYLRFVVEHFLALHAPPAALFGGGTGAAAVDEFLPMLTVREDDARQGYNLATHTGILDPAPFLDLFVPSAAGPTPDPHSNGSKPWTTLFSNDPASPSSAPTQAPSSSRSKPWMSLFSSDPSSLASASAPPSSDPIKDFRFGVLKKLLWFSVKALGYDARKRTLLRRLAAVMGLPWSAITQEEEQLGRTLFAEATGTASGLSLEKVMPKLSLTDWKRNATIGAAALTGGALLAVTGGLAAPVIAGSVMAFGQTGVAVGTALGTASGLTATSAAFGAAGAGVFGKKTDTRTRGVREFQYDLVSEGHGLNVPELLDQLDQVLARYAGREDELFQHLREAHGIQAGSLENDPLGLLHDELSSAAVAAATGADRSSAKKLKDMLTLSNLTDAAKSERLRGWRWRDRFPHGDQYSVAWDESLLHQVVAYAEDKALGLLKTVALKSLLAAVALPKSILDMADMIDRVWALMMNAADAAGKLLAQSLREREHGLRPVTLLGVGMGARMIIACLKELAKTPDEGCGIVESAVLLGAPTPVEKSDWASARRVVAGRLVNGFSSNDWMLSIMYRYQGWALNCAGISSIDVPGMDDALAFAADHLSEAQKRGLAGLCAWLLPDAFDGSHEREWSQQYLALLVEKFLGLPRSQVDALLPMLTARPSEKAEQKPKPTLQKSDTLELAPFLGLLVPEAAPRRGFRAFFRRTKKDDKQQQQQQQQQQRESVGSNQEASAGAMPVSLTLVSTEAFRLQLLEKQLWFTVKAIGYDARARVLLRRLADVMGIEWRLVTLEEVVIGRALFAEATAMPLEKMAAAPSVWDWKRNVAIGAAAVTGGALLAVTGGLAAPLIATSLTALGGAGVAIGTALGSTAGIHAATILFGTAGAGVVGMKTDTRTRGVHEFHF